MRNSSVQSLTHTHTPTHTQAPVRPRVPRSRIFDPRCQPLPLPLARSFLGALAVAWWPRSGEVRRRGVAAPGGSLLQLLPALSSISDPEQVLCLVNFLFLVKFDFSGVVSLLCLDLAFFRVGSRLASGPCGICGIDFHYCLIHFTGTSPFLLDKVSLDWWFSL